MLAQIQTSVPTEVLQKQGQIPFVMAVVVAPSMTVLNMMLERVFLTERLTGGRKKLIDHYQNHRK